MATKIIALDAGHGINTPGKRTPDGIREWYLNDKVRDKVVAYLRGYDVHIIFPDNNEGSIDEPLKERRNTYIAADADAMISIHHNAFTGDWNSATGVETYVDRNATAADRRLAECIQKRLPNYTGLKDRGIKEANWTVINQNSVPAVLTEGGFMDNKKDYVVITSDKGQDAYARAVAEGLIEFLALKKVNAGAEAPVITKKLYKVQCGAFKDKAYADKRVKELQNIGFGTYIFEEDGWYKVQCGAYAKYENAVALRKRLTEAGFSCYIATIES